MIDVGSANVRAGELEGYASSLRLAKQVLEQYQNSIQANWQSAEVAFYMSAIDRVQNRLQKVSSELESIADSVSSTASQIREEEAQERARIEAQKRAQEEAEKCEEEEAAERARQTVAAVTSIIRKIRW